MSFSEIIGIDFSNYLKGVGTSTEDVLAANGTLKRYERCKKNGESMKITFSLAAQNGDLILQDGMCTVIMPNKEINGTPYDVSDRAYRLNKSYIVKVQSVDREKREVIVSHYAVRSDDRRRLCEQLDDVIRKHQYCVVPAKVYRVHPSIALLDIGGLGIPGYLKIANWSSAYTSSLRAVVRSGDIINIAVVASGEKEIKEKNFKSLDNMNVYECSRRTIVSDDPWEGIEEKVKKGCLVRLKCIERLEHHFYGTIDGIPDIHAYCYYPDDGAPLSKSDIVVGCFYEGYVKKVDEKEHRLRVRVFKRADID